MNTKTFLFGLAMQISVALHGQTTIALDTTSLTRDGGSATNLTRQSPALGYLIGERGLNHRVWNKVVAITNRFGSVSYATNKAYVELQDGLHYRDAQGRLRESKEQIEILPGGGAGALQGQHQVYFPSDIYDGVIEVVTADGRRLKSRPLGLSYFDGTNNVLVAQLTNSVGLILRSGNQVIYTNAFTDFAADLVVTYRKGGVESDVVFREQPPKPSQLGINAQRARLQLWTEFFETAAPEPKEARTNQVESLIDRDLKFGAMKMVRGKAFALTNNPTRNQTNSPAARDRVGETDVYKSWQQQQDGRSFLIEELSYRQVRTELERLRPRATTNRLASVQRLSPKLELPPLRMAQAGSDVTIQLAQADLLSEPGYVLDWVMVNSTSELMLTAGTYYVVGDVYVDNLSHGGSVVVKYDRGTTSAGPGRLIVGYFTPDSSYVDGLRNEPKPEPIIFTSMDDPECGLNIEGSSGDPYPVAGTGMVAYGEFSFGGRCRYLGAAITLSYHASFSGWSFENCRAAIRYAGSYYSTLGITVSDSQFSDCAACIYQDGGGSQIQVDFPNTTFTDCTTLFSGSAGPNEFNSFTVVFQPFTVLAGAKLYMDVVADPITANGPYATGIKVNVNGGEPGLYWGDEASFNYEYYYNGYMGALPGNGRLILGGEGLTVSSLTITYTNGLMGLTYSHGAIPDGDGDGLLDAWEQLYFGNLDQTWNGDSDNDGLSNLQEYQLGTNPVSSDSDGDGLLDGWEWIYFGTFLQNGWDDCDGDGRRNYEEYAEGTNPNTISFSASSDSTYTSDSTPAGSATVRAGLPSRIVTRVGSDPRTLTDGEVDALAWQSCPAGTESGSVLSVNPSLGTAEGWYTVWVGMRGPHPAMKPTWNSYRVKLDTTPPVIHLVPPQTATATVAYRRLQVKAYCDEPLGKVTYDLASTDQNLLGGPAFVTTQTETRSDFQVFDLDLTPGVQGNTVTLHAWDRAGNEATQILTLHVNPNTAPPANAGILWPETDNQVASDLMTVVGSVGDPGSTITATVTDAGGQVTTLTGLVDREGRYFIERVPLGQGLNSLSVTVTDGLGRSATTSRQIQRASITLGGSLMDGSFDRLEATFIGDMLPAGVTSVTINDQDVDSTPGQSWQDFLLTSIKDQPTINVHVVATLESGQTVEWTGIFEKPAVVRIGTFSDSVYFGESSPGYSSSANYNLPFWEDDTAVEVIEESAVGSS